MRVQLPGVVFIDISQTFKEGFFKTGIIAVGMRSLNGREKSDFFFIQVIQGWLEYVL